MSTYIDGFVFPISCKYLSEYKEIDEQVAEIWKEHGAIAYYEYGGDKLNLEETRSFIDSIDVNEDEVVVLCWSVFPSKEVRNTANENVPSDPQMANLVAPIMDADLLIFDANRMVNGGFKALVD
ncbi:MAG: DUF1428 domain-containing protein [Saprospiraceae bacterium]